MTKREIIRETKDILCGNSGHTNIIIWKEGRSWRCETGLNRFQKSDFSDESIQFSHCCNEITLKETKKEIDVAWHEADIGRY